MDKITHTSIKKRLLATLLLVVFVFIGLIARLFYVQIIQGTGLKIKAFNQWTRDLPLKADRGEIVDCNGVVLAESDTVYTLYARPNELTDIEKLATLLSPILEIGKDKLYEKLSKKGVSEITVAKQLSRSQMISLISLDVNGLYLTADSTRRYPLGDFLTQVLGFTNVDGVGQSGVEQYYDQYLKGVDGATYTPTDLIGKKLADGVTYYQDGIKGMCVQLSIDSTMQLLAQKATAEAQLKYNSKSASCIIMSAKTGQVKAISSSPSYDLNDIPRNDMELLLQGSRNTIIADVYEPGSTFKILTSAIGIEENKIKNSYYCSGSALVDGQRIKCWRSIGHGSQNFEQGIQNSCNCVFMDIALSVGSKTMYEYFDAFGLGQKTGIDASGEAKGLLIEQSKVKNVDLARIGFGQAIAVTPIQLATAVCSVVNGGYLYTPTIVQSITDGAGNVAYRANPVAKNRTISEQTSQILKQYLLGVVNEGSGKNARVAGYSIGGKTGTAQKYENGTIARGKYISSFIGFADVEDDTYVCLMLVDEPQGYVYYGSIVAAPYVGEIFAGIFAYKGIAPVYDEQEEALNKEIVMPDLMDMPLANATATLKNLGLDFELSGECGKVVYQVPSAGAKVKLKTVAFIACE
ncbi:MAG: penicillin-binding protein [Christensenellales bacterium]